MKNRKLFLQTKLCAEIKILYIELECLQRQSFKMSSNYEEYSQNTKTFIILTMNSQF